MYVIFNKFGVAVQNDVMEYSLTGRCCGFELVNILTGAGVAQSV
jgi:hypothetical protein